MVQILPEVPSFGTQVARGLGAGFGTGINQSGQMAMQLGLEKLKKNLRQQLINDIEGGGSFGQSGSMANQLMGTQSKNQQSLDQQFIETLPQIEQVMGRDLTSEDLNQLYSKWQQLISGNQQQAQKQFPDDFTKAKQYAAAGEHDLSRIAMEEAKQNRKESFALGKEERDILSIRPKEFLKDVEDYRKGSRDIDMALRAELDAITRGEVDPFSSGHVSEIMKQLGLPQSLAAPFETVGSKEFRTGQKTFLAKTFKDAFRGATTQGQVALASSMLAESGASKEGNLASLFLLQSQHLIEQEKIRLTDEAVEKGVPALKIPAFVNKQLDKYANQINDSYFESLKLLRKHGADYFMGQGEP